MPSQPLPVLLTSFRDEVSTTNGRAAQTRSLTPIVGSALIQLAPEVGGTVTLALQVRRAKLTRFASANKERRLGGLSAEFLEWQLPALRL